MSGPLTWLDPHVEQYLLVDDDEHIVTRSWHRMAIFWPGVRFGVGLWILAGAFVFTSGSSGSSWCSPWRSVVQAVWEIAEQLDRFVITNMRAFRVHGIFSQHRATTPMTRILDITVNQPVIGRIFGYGDFIFESAAQDQGLREIQWVSGSTTVSG